MWNSLRGVFFREISKEDKSKSGMDADEIYQSKKMRSVEQIKKTAKRTRTFQLSNYNELHDEDPHVI